MNVKECSHIFRFLFGGGQLGHNCCLPTGDDHTIHRCVPECGAEWTDDGRLITKGTGRGEVVRWNALTLGQRERLYPGYLERIYQQEALNDERSTEAVSRDSVHVSSTSS